MINSITWVLYDKKTPCNHTNLGEYKSIGCIIENDHQSKIQACELACLRVIYLNTVTYVVVCNVCS